MIRRLLHHASSHSIAYLALVCSLLALTGAAYASFQLPNGSVGEKTIKNQVIDPVKWDPIYVTAFVRRWASVGVDGRLVAGSPNGQSASISPGSFDVTWGDAFKSFCIALATVQGGSGNPTQGGSSTSGFANASINAQPGNATLVNVKTYNALGQPTPEPFYLAIVCPRGAGGGQLYSYTLP